MLGHDKGPRLSLPASPLQIENPVRVLPLHSFCVGMRTAALSMLRYQRDVQRAINTGLASVAAHGVEASLEKMAGHPGTPQVQAAARQQEAKQQQQKPAQPANGVLNAVSVASSLPGQDSAMADLAAVRPQPGMSR
jgi:hypothetical protein